MKKKLIISFFAVIISLSALVGVAFAKGTIKIVVNGQQVTSDVAPQMINNRVMVPLSVVSNALGAHVSWDQKNQTVTIKNNVSTQKDIWNQELDWGNNGWPSGWPQVKNLIALYIAGFDNRDDELIRSISVEEFDMIPIGGMYPSIIDYDIVDAQETKNSYKVRVQVITYEEEMKGEMWDFEIGQGKIKSMKIVNHFDINEYTVFPGLTFKNQ